MVREIQSSGYKRFSLYIREIIMLYDIKDSNLADSLDGSYISIQNYDMTNHIAYFNNQSYICFQGNFIVVDNNLSGSIAKFCGEENLLTTNNNLTKKFKYDSTNKFYVFA